MKKFFSPDWRNQFSAQRKNSLYLPPKKIMFQEKEFLILTQKINYFPIEKISYTFLKKSIFWKKILILVWKNQFSKRKKLPILPQKDHFPNKKFLILAWKTNFLYLQKKVKFFWKVLHFRCILNMALLFFM